MIVCWSIIRYIAVFREIVILSRSEGSLVAEAESLRRALAQDDNQLPFASSL
jgi:hypothetical protein